MSTSTNGILVYGFLVGDEEEPPDWLIPDEDGDREFDTFVAAKLGVSAPSVPFEGNEAAYKAYWDAKRKMLQTVAVDLVMHCSCDCPMYILGVKASKRTAYRGTPVALDQSIQSEPAWATELADFCKQMGIPYSEPQWWLASLWC